MSIRDWMNNNAVVVTLVAVVVLVLALVLSILSLKGPGVQRAGNVYFYDLGIKKIFTGKSDRIAPFDTPTGVGNGVRAMVFNCGACKPDYSGMTIEELEDAGAFVGWLQKFPDDALEAIKGVDELSDADRFGLSETPQMIRKPDEDEWVDS